MRLLLKNAHLYRHQAFSDTDVLIEDGIIKKIGACNEEADRVIDLHGALVWMIRKLLKTSLNVVKRMHR